MLVNVKEHRDWNSRIDKLQRSDQSEKITIYKNKTLTRALVTKMLKVPISSLYAVTAYKVTMVLMLIASIVFWFPKELVIGQAGDQDAAITTCVGGLGYELISFWMKCGRVVISKIDTVCIHNWYVCILFFFLSCRTGLQLNVDRSSLL